ncbi:hypothetical protein V6N13_103653 [Hibiscus sabdariffa]
MYESSEGEVARPSAKVVVKAMESSGSQAATTSAKVVKPWSRPSEIASQKAVKPRVVQLKFYRCKGPHKLWECPNRVKLSKMDKPERSKVAKLGSLELSSVKACDQEQNGLSMSEKATKELVEDVHRKNISLKTKIVERLKGAEPRRADKELVEDVRKDNIALETTAEKRSKGFEPRRATKELDEDFRRENITLETTIRERSKEAKSRRT